MFKCHVFRWYKLNFNPLAIYTFLFEISKLHFGTSLFCHSLNIFEARDGLAILPLISSQQFFSQNYVIITKLPPLKFAFYFIKRTKAINKHLFNKYASNTHYESQSVLSVKIQWLGDIGKQAPIINMTQSWLIRHKFNFWWASGNDYLLTKGKDIVLFHMNGSPVNFACTLIGSLMCNSLLRWQEGQSVWEFFL